MCTLVRARTAHSEVSAQRSELRLNISINLKTIHTKDIQYANTAIAIINSFPSAYYAAEECPITQFHTVKINA